MGKKRRLKSAKAKFNAKHSSHPRAKLLAKINDETAESGEADEPIIAVEAVKVEKSPPKTKLAPKATKTSKTTTLKASTKTKQQSKTRKRSTSTRKRATKKKTVAASV